MPQKNEEKQMKSPSTVAVSHTPGPWIASEGTEDDDTRWCVIQNVTERGHLIAEIHNGAPGDTLKTEKANARLIAAAPELLAACEFAVQWLGGGDAALVQAAIDKARGAQ